MTAGLCILLLALPSISFAKGLLTPRSDSDTPTVRGRQMSRSDVKDAMIAAFGADHPMVDVARCESDFRQFTADGDPLRNPRSGAVGVFQILPSVHEQPAEALGLDIYSLEGNIAYARKLYDTFGLRPWSPSSLCWDDGNVDGALPTDTGKQSLVETSTKVPVRVRGDSLTSADLAGTPYRSADATSTNESVNGTKTGSPTVEPLITKKLVSGVRDPQVKKLQQILNNSGYQLSASGPGSPGQETNFFGGRTRAAVKEFQCDQGIVCEGGRYSTGYGLVGPETRQALTRIARDIGPNERLLPNGVVVRTDEETDQEDGDTVADMSQTAESVNTNASLQEQIEQARELVMQLQNQIK